MGTITGFKWKTVIFVLVFESDRFKFSGDLDVFRLVWLEKTSDGEIVDDLLDLLHVVLQRVELLAEAVVLQVQQAETGLQKKELKFKTYYKNEL